MRAFTPAEATALASRHPEIFTGSLRRRLAGWLIGGGIALYLVFAWWFFSVGAIFANANWGIASAYMADWVSYEVRPDIELGEDHLEISFPRFSPLGDNPDPDWLTRKTAVVAISAKTDGAASSAAGAGSGFMGAIEPAPPEGGSTGFLGPLGGNEAAVSTLPPADAPSRREEAVVEASVAFGEEKSLRILPGIVRATRGGETITFEIEGERVEAHGPLPDWVSQSEPGAKAILYFGVGGSAEVQTDEVRIRRRFLGWENFFFDTRSPFFGRPADEVISLILFGERLRPETSNATLAWSNFLNNSEWQHGDVWLKLLQTIVMAFVGTVLASLLAFPLAFAAARNIYPSRAANFLLKRFFDFLRSVDMLIWALFFTRAFGPGPLAGISAIFVTDTGTFGKLYSEALENIDDKQREGVRSVGAAPSAVQRYGVLPQVLPVFLSQSLYFWESNTRSATIIGAVGAGGIGLKLWEAMRTNSDWENVAYMVLLILLVVFVFDNISSMLRRRLTGTQVTPAH
ncbi:phosphonate ABC transporter, permease protein PhnE [Chelativorans sp.]|uniref:phosphonate ABC transporter, permease protein PhnE n=1 Tax=Chelativorans sp. TaxID=2203393 RepID=UPI00281254C1|nr:phosphonate ABC transporter, permease protein PhnE [Chelativorans sp.]